MSLQKIALIPIMLLWLFGCHTGPKLPFDIPSGNVSVQAPEVESWDLGNGLKVLYYQSKEIPLISASLYIPKGGLSNDTGIPELSYVTVQQIREGGVPGMSPDDFDFYLDSKAAKIESSQDNEITSVSFSCLSEDFDSILKHFSSIVISPNFDEKRLSLWKKLSKDAVKRRKDSPDGMASMLFAKLLYGEGSPWYHPLSRESIDMISRTNLSDMHRRLFSPEEAVLILTGDIEPSIIKDKVGQAFGSWNSDSSLPKLKRFALGNADEYRPVSGIYVIEGDFEQASVLLGHRSVNREETSLYTQGLLNRIIGSSGFGSILFKEIREKRGLVYSIHGSFNSSMTEGSFQVSLGTKVSSAIDALKSTQEILYKVQKGYLPENEIEAARVALTKSFVFKYEDPFYAAKRPTLLSLYGFPKEYDEEFVDQVMKVSKNDLLQYSKEYLKPDEMVSVIVGKISAEEIKSTIQKGIKVCRVTFDDKPVLDECF
jgi:zinc protease